MTRNRDEDRLQMVIVSLLRLAGKPGLFWCSIPNEGKRKPQTANRLKALGMVAGAPDLLLLWNGKAIGLELKAEKGRQTPEQRDVERAWMLAGGVYKVCRGYAEAKGFLDLLGCLTAQADMPRFQPREAAA